MTQLQHATKYVIFSIFLGLFIYIFTPFFTSFVLAALFAIIFYPLHKRLSKKISARAGALLTVITTIVIILIPLAIFLGLVAKEAIKFMQTFNTAGITQFLSQYKDTEFLGYKLDIAIIEANLQDWISVAGNTIYLVARDVGASIMNFGFLFFIFLIAYYYFLKEGDKIIAKIKSFLPFTKKQNEVLVSQCKFVSKTVFTGNLITSLIAGLIAFIGFYIFNVPGALILAILAVILSLIPTVGTFFVYLIAGLITIPFTGHMPFIYLMIYFIVAEFILRENLIKPKIMDNKLSAHHIIIFFAIIGGIQTFGSIGLLYGPLIAIIFLSMFHFVAETSR